MTSKQVTVTKYIACDGTEFDNFDKCHLHELALRKELDNNIVESRRKITAIKEEAYERHLRCRLAKREACDALNNGLMEAFHEKMAEYYKHKSCYNYHKQELRVERGYLNNLIDKCYFWFGHRRHKSMAAKAERRAKSLRWRQENTPDKWRTPNKIRVNKLPKEEQ